MSELSSLTAAAAAAAPTCLQQLHYLRRRPHCRPHSPRYRRRWSPPHPVAPAAGGRPHAYDAPRFPPARREVEVESDAAGRDAGLCLPTPSSPLIPPQPHLLCRRGGPVGVGEGQHPAAGDQVAPQVQQRVAGVAGRQHLAARGGGRATQLDQRVGAGGTTCSGS